MFNNEISDFFISVMIYTIVLVILAFPITFLYNESLHKVFNMPELNYYYTLCLVTFFRMFYFISFTSPKTE